MKWKRQPQEQEGTYMFSGIFVITHGIRALLTDDEIRAIYFEIRGLVDENNGLDYLQVYQQADGGQKLFFIDQLNREMLASGDFDNETCNYCTLMLASEY